MTILDTNVVSAIMRESPDTAVVAWLDGQARTSIWITSITVLEVQFGLQILESGKRRTALNKAFDNFLDRMGQRVASFDHGAANHAASLMAARRKEGRVVELRDTMIAGIVLAQRAILATRNVAHFNDISAAILNPWAATV